MVFTITTRWVPMGFLALGTLVGVPAIFFDATTSSWLIPLCVVGSTIPMLVSGAMISGYIHHINIWLPNSARRSKDALMNFVERVPPTTRLQVKSIWFRPWLVIREVEFRDLRRLPKSYLRLANLEQAPLWSQNVISDAKQHPISSWIAKTWLGRFTVVSNPVRDRSRAPGAWDRMWEQIPMVGEGDVKDDSVRRRSEIKVRPVARGMDTKARKPPRPPPPSTKPRR